MNELSAQSYKLVRFEKRQVKIHQDLVGLLWFADGELKNYTSPRTHAARYFSIKKRFPSTVTRV